MVGNTGRTADTRRIRRLKTPQALEVEASEDGVPLRLRARRRLAGRDPAARRLAHRPALVARRAECDAYYYRVAPEDGPPLTIYYDDVCSGDWSRQEY